MTKKQKHREPIINAAVTLFRRQGYAATGINDIVDLSESPKGSLYHYFPAGKASIAVAAVEAASQRSVDTLNQLSNSCKTAGDLIKAEANLLIDWMKKSGFRDGCPMTTVLLELTPKDRLVTSAGRQAYANRINIVCEKLITDGFSPKKAKRLAILSNSAIQGALVQARVERSGKPIETVAEEISELFTHFDK